MRVTINQTRLELVQGDITSQATTAIVNAANSGLLGGGGVDGAIHEVGGPAIMQETRAKYPDGCPTGSAVSTGAGNLPADYVFHAVGPVWNGGNQGEAELLSSAYRTCLELAMKNQCESVAFPSLSTGAYRYPLDLAAEVALKTVIEFLEKEVGPKRVCFVLFDAGAYGAYSAALERMVRDRS